MMNEHVLFVDDDPNILEAIQRNFRRILHIHTAQGPYLGLREIQEKGPFAVIVADMNMPLMNGVEFLKRVRELSPDTARIMLTGNDDIKTAIDAVNKGWVFRFLTKPCPSKMMNDSLMAGIEQYRLVTEAKINRDELYRKNQELEMASLTDPLSGLPNRRAMDALLKRESNRAVRSGRTFVIMMADIDHFKRINDTYGHDAGDMIIKNVAKVFQAHVRKEDLCARWGGEEFLLLLTEAELPYALVAAERIRHNVETMATVYDKVNIGVTISGGLSVYHEGEDVRICIKRIDVCLYKAKESGRNQVWYQANSDVLPSKSLPALIREETANHA